MNSKNEELLLLSYSNSKVVSLIVDIINPTMNLSNGVFAKIPSPLSIKGNNRILVITSQNISISKQLGIATSLNSFNLIAMELSLESKY